MPIHVILQITFLLLIECFSFGLNFHCHLSTFQAFFRLQSACLSIKENYFQDDYWTFRLIPELTGAFLGPSHIFFWFHLGYLPCPCKVICMFEENLRKVTVWCEYSASFQRNSPLRVWENLDEFSLQYLQPYLSWTGWGP